MVKLTARKRITNAVVDVLKKAEDRMFDDNDQDEAMDVVRMHELKESELNEIRVSSVLASPQVQKQLRQIVGVIISSLEYTAHYCEPDEDE